MTGKSCSSDVKWMISQFCIKWLKAYNANLMNMKYFMIILYILICYYFLTDSITYNLYTLYIQGNNTAVIQITGKTPLMVLYRILTLNRYFSWNTWFERLSTLKHIVKKAWNLYTMSSFAHELMSGWTYPHNTQQPEQW